MSLAFIPPVSNSRNAQENWNLYLTVFQSLLKKKIRLMDTSIFIFKKRRSIYEIVTESGKITTSHCGYTSLTVIFFIFNTSMFGKKEPDCAIQCPSRHLKLFIRYSILVNCNLLSGSVDLLTKHQCSVFQSANNYTMDLQVIHDLFGCMLLKQLYDKLQQVLQNHPKVPISDVDGRGDLRKRITHGSPQRAINFALLPLVALLIGCEVLHTRSPGGGGLNSRLSTFDHHNTFLHLYHFFNLHRKFGEI